MLPSLEPGSVFADYRVEALVGRGGMGVVHRAVEIGLGRPVALKVIAPELAASKTFQERFEREARAAASLDHPNVVPVYAAGEHDGLLFIAMRYVEGVDLRSLLADGRGLEPARAARLVAQLGGALEAAHELGLVHRDVKPANVLVSGSGDAEHAYLTDFGVANRQASNPALTGEGEWVGTLDYVAPEQLRGETVDGRADIYALGCLLYETLTGQVPFPRENDLAKLWAHVSDPAPSALEVAPEAPAALADVAERAMAKAADDRFETAGAMARAALAAVGEERTRPVGRRQASAARLSAPLTRTIGREDDRARVVELLGMEDVHLVTLTGVGGVGKTRLALEVARALEPDLPDGAWFVSLAATAAPEHVASAIAAGLGATPLQGERPELAVERFLRSRRGLLVLDNLEHLLPATPLVTSLLTTCPGLKVLATSREPLRLQAERGYRVEPLTVPDAGDPDALRQAPAGVLFLERARSHDQSFDPSGADVQAIADVCRRLDGLPLAIELAAARMAVLSPAELNDRLANALDVLGRGPRDAPERQLTLRATIDWSHRLLTTVEARAFARFAVFAGGATIDAAELVTGATLETLESLVHKELLRRRHVRGEGARLEMLETVRAYARERLDRETDAPEVHRRHAEHCLALAERADCSLYTRDEADWLPRLDAEVDNLRAALEWTVAGGAPEIGLRLAGVLARFWVIRGRFSEGLAWVEAALNAAGAEASVEDRARALRASAHLLEGEGSAYDRGGQLGEARARSERALELSRKAGEPAGIAQALLIACEFEVAETLPQRRRRALAEEALSHARRARDQRLEAVALMDRALAVGAEPGMAEFDEAEAALRRLGSTRHLLGLYNSAAYNCIKEGRPEAARRALEPAVPIVRSLGDPRAGIFLEGNIGLEALFSGDHERARTAFQEQVRLCALEGWEALAAEGLGGLAAVAAVEGDSERAARLLGAAEALGSVGDADVLKRLEQRFLGPARDRLGGEAWSSGYAAGAALGLREAAELAAAGPSRR
jgi:non-specific serine/threonine protein kinase